MIIQYVLDYVHTNTNVYVNTFENFQINLVFTRNRELGSVSVIRQKNFKFHYQIYLLFQSYSKIPLFLLHRKFTSFNLFVHS